MRRKSRWAAGLAATVAAGLVAGCGGDDGVPPVSTSADAAKVTGTVRVGGKPVTKGTVVFDPANVKRKDAKPVNAKIGADGMYSLETLAGDNRVAARGPAISDEGAGVDRGRP